MLCPTGKIDRTTLPKVWNSFLGGDIKDPSVFEYVIEKYF